MAQYRSERRRPASVQALKAAECPPVADLLDFAQGAASPEDQQRIQKHLHDTGCSACRGWITKATGDPPANHSPLLSANPHFRSMADAAKWQRQSLDDLERRLKQIDDGAGPGPHA